MGLGTMLALLQLYGLLPSAGTQDVKGSKSATNSAQCWTDCSPMKRSATSGKPGTG